MRHQTHFRCIRVRPSLSVCFSLLLLLSTANRPLRAQTEIRYEVAATKNVMMAMRDGVRLATDIYRPARNGTTAEGKFPVLLERTPYNKEAGSPATVEMFNYFVQRGYVVIVQDVRGRYKSEGRWRPIRDDPNDGFDTAKWVGAQPWSDGSIGTMGTSYDGAT